MRTNQDIGSRYALAALTSGLGGGLSFVLYGFAPLMLARILGPHEYGVYTAAMTATSLIAGLFQMGQHSALHKMLPEHAGSDRTRGGMILADLVILTSAFLFIFCVIFLAGSNWVATAVYHDPGLAGALQISAAMIFCLTFFNLSASVTAGLQDFRAYNGGMLFRAVAYLTLACLGAKMFGLKGALLGQLLALAIAFLVLARCAVRLARRRFPGAIRPDFSREALEPIAAFVVPAFLLTLLNLPGYWWITAQLARTHGFAEVGIFSVAYAITQIIWMIPVNLYTPAMTFLSEAYGSRDRELFETLVNENLRAIWLLTTPIALAAVLLSPILPGLLFGAAYQDAARVTLILSFAAPPMAMVGLINTVISSAGRIWWNVGITLLWSTCFAAGTWLCIPRWGAVGAALAFSASQFLYALMVCAYLARFVRLDRRVLRVTALLSFAGFVLAAFVAVRLTGPGFYFAAAGLILAFIMLEWRYVCGSTERRVVGRGVALLKLAAARS